MKTIAIIISTILSITSLQANPLDELKSCTTETATKIVNEHLLLDKVDVNKLTELKFTPLIGANLDDWKIHNDKPEVKFTLKDGVVSGTCENLRGNSFLYTNEEYDSYLLYFEFRFDHLKGNSGLMYHSKYHDAK